MSTLTVSDPKVQSALASCAEALRAFADYELDTEIATRMRELGERKEFLDPAQHAELLALVAFTEQRSLESLRAQLALKELNRIVPNLVPSP